MEEELQEEQNKLLNKELPNLLHQILIIRLMPGMCAKQLLERDVETIKKITNAECEHALNYLK